MKHGVNSRAQLSEECMRTSILPGTWFGLAAGVAALGWASPASAAECAEDRECPKGFTCEVSEDTACPDVPACDDEQSCEEAPPCTVEQHSSCVSIDCSADSDCADGMVCETVKHERCSTPGAPASDPGMEPDPDAEPLPPDAAPPEGSCEVEERNYCMPKYLLPCEAAADCGPGFTCEATEVCSCSSSPSSGGSSTTGGDAGTPDGGGADSDSGEDADAAERPAAPPDGEDDGRDENCVCEAGPIACHLVITECAADSDCPSGMTCEDNPEGTCTSTPDGAEECTADPEKICLPPYVDLVSGGTFDGALQSGVDSDESSNPEEPPRGAPGEAVDDGNDADGSRDGSSASGGGCSVGAVGAPVSAWAGFGLLLGAALVGRRRRA